MSTSSSSSASRRAAFFRWQDRLFALLTFVAAAFVIVAMATILVVLFIEAWPAFEAFGWQFFVSSEWNPVDQVFGALSPVIGTLLTTFLALLFAIPISFGIAIVITELAPNWLKRPIGTAIELLAAIPSIIYGMWGLFVFAPFFAKHIQPGMSATLGQLPLIGAWFQGPPIGISVFVAGLILAIMVIPFIASIMRDVFDIVPRQLRESAYSMGSTTWEVIWKVVLPYTKVGIVGGVMLGLARALGETMAVTFVIGNAQFLNNFSFFLPGATIASTIANEFNEADGLHLSALIAIGFMLFVITFVILLLSQILLAYLARQHSGKSN